MGKQCDRLNHIKENHIKKNRKEWELFRLQNWNLALTYISE